MDKLIPPSGKKEWFMYKTDIRKREGGLIDNFTIELEKYAKLGKAYDECVLIELTDEMHISLMNIHFFEGLIDFCRLRVYKGKQKYKRR